MSKKGVETLGDDYEEDYDEDEDVEEGLTAEETAKGKAEFRKYLLMIGVMVLVIGPIFAWSTYFLTNLNEGQKDLHDYKFALIYKYQLGYVYLALFILYLTRQYLMVNTNAARAPAGCERPDQHVYTSKVLMVSEGAAGRFNRSQRAAANMDESLPLYALALVFAGFVFGPFILIPAALTFLGRILFANGYTKALNARGPGFGLGMIAEVWTHGLVGLCAVKGILFPHIPF
jgi:hypothetical protein